MVTAIRLYRVAKDIKQYTLAQSIGMEPSLLSRIESGRKSPTPDQVKRIALALDVSPEVLVEGVATNAN